MLADVPFLTRRGGPDSTAGRSESRRPAIRLLIDDLCRDRRIDDRSLGPAFLAASAGLSGFGAIGSIGTPYCLRMASISGALRSSTVCRLSRNSLSRRRTAMPMLYWNGMSLSESFAGSGVSISGTGDCLAK